MRSVQSSMPERLVKSLSLRNHQINHRQVQSYYFHLVPSSNELGFIVPISSYLIQNNPYPGSNRDLIAKEAKYAIIQVLFTHCCQQTEKEMSPLLSVHEIPLGQQLQETSKTQTILILLQVIHTSKVTQKKKKCNHLLAKLLTSLHGKSFRNT